jgi:hypothetical protein
LDDDGGGAHPAQEIGFQIRILFHLLARGLHDVMSCSLPACEGWG